MEFGPKIGNPGSDIPGAVKVANITASPAPSLLLPNSMMLLSTVTELLVL